MTDDTGRRMEMWALCLIAAVLVTLTALAAWRQLDRRADALAWATLVQAAGVVQRTYDPAMVDRLLEPARRYFNYTSEVGTTLFTPAEIDMTGQIGLGTKDAPNDRTMRASQILAPPHGRHSDPAIRWPIPSAAKRNAAITRRPSRLTLARI